jgi:hypothetical protein
LVILGGFKVNIKDLIKAELDYLSEEDLAEFYQLLKARTQKNLAPHDELGDLLEACQVSTGISDLAEQHDHVVCV